MGHPIIKDFRPLNEDYRTEDLFDFSKQRLQIADRLKHARPMSILGVVGPYGSGKSATLFQLEKGSDGDKVAWIHFDAWKYPERQNLWEGFVLDVADALGQKDQVLQYIEGKGRQIKNKGVADKLLTVASMVPSLGSIDKVKQLFENSPATRVFQLQNVLIDLLRSFKQREIYIVVEDIDRSGDMGVYFLETLNHFLKNSEITDVRVYAIAPISDSSYYSKRQDSYLKCLDYIDFFIRHEYNVSGFVSKVFRDELFTDNQLHKIQLTNLLSGVFRFCPNVDIRILKVILRDFAVRYSVQSEKGWSPDWRVTLCTTFAKYITPDNALTDASTISLYEKLKRETQIGVNSRSIFAPFLFSLQRNQPTFYEQKNDGAIEFIRGVPNHFRVVDRVPSDNIGEFPSAPWVPQHLDRDEHKICIASFYVQD